MSKVRAEIEKRRAVQIDKADLAVLTTAEAQISNPTLRGKLQARISELRGKIDRAEGKKS